MNLGLSPPVLLVWGPVLRQTVSRSALHVATDDQYWDPFSGRDAETKKGSTFPVILLMESRHDIINSLPPFPQIVYELFVIGNRSGTLRDTDHRRVIYEHFINLPIYPLK